MQSNIGMIFKDASRYSSTTTVATKKQASILSFLCKIVFVGREDKILFIKQHFVDDVVKLIFFFLQLINIMSGFFCHI